MQKLALYLDFLLNNFQYSLMMSEILYTIIEGTWSSKKYIEILSAYKVNSNSVALKQESVDVTIQYARLCLADNALSEEEINSMNILKKLLYIKEGDYYKYGRQQDVKNLIATQLYRLYEDDEINYEEAIYKVELQGLFNLSFKEFENVVRDIAKESYERGADYFKLDTYSFKYQNDTFSS